MKLKIVKNLGKALVFGSSVLLAGNATAAENKLYVIENGKLGYETWVGMKIYQRGRCEACHGPDATGGAAFPNLLEALKTTDKAQLTEIVTNGKGSMPPMLRNVMGIKMIKKKDITEEQAMDSLYAYLKGRSDGAIPTGSLKKIKK